MGNPRFGTDGWRGIIADEFTFENLRKVARAAGEVLNRRAPGLILIGYDGRFLSQQFAKEVGTVLIHAGLKVSLSSSSLPTPALSSCVVQKKASWGIMITASHNPSIYNGFKLKDGYGRSAPVDVTQEIESRLSSEPLKDVSPTPIATFDFLPIYSTYLRQRLDWKLLKSFNKPICFDSMSGATAGIPQHLLKKINAKIIAIHETANPLFSGLHPEPIGENLSDLSRAVRKSRAAIGIALDGDGDRLGIVDDLGNYLTPHQVFPLLALYHIEVKGWRGKVVQSVSLGALGERIARHFQLPFEEVSVGFKHIAERLLKGDTVIGGEESGGYGLQGGLPERDGILSGLLLVEMMAATGKSLSSLVKSMEARFGAARFMRHDLRLPRPIWDKQAFVKSVQQQLPNSVEGLSIAEMRPNDGLKIVFTGGAWLLMRPSGTEPLLRVYAESSSLAMTRRLLAHAKTWALAAL